MKKYLNTKTITLLITILLIGILSTLESCSNSDISTISNSKYVEFLDIDTTNLKNLNAAETLILSKAKDRVNSHITFDNINKVYRLNQTSAIELNISNRLFDHIKHVIQITNQNISKVNITQDLINPKLLHVSSKSIKQNTRFKVTAEAPQIGQGGIDISWDHADIYLTQSQAESLENALSTGKDAAALVAIVSGFFGQGEVTLVASVANWLFDKGASGLKDNIGEDGSIITYDYFLGGFSSCKR